MKPADERLRAVFDTLEPLIERRWGIPVRIRDVPAPFTGDLDGAEIHVDYDLDLEDAVFILVHLFGHTVQWNVSEEARLLGSSPRTSWSEDELTRLRVYEQQACRYSLALLHEAGIHDLDGWISDFATCDTAYLMHFYRTGEKRPFRSFWHDDSPVLAPMPIPDFAPTQWVSRWGGVVV